MPYSGRSQVPPLTICELQVLEYACEGKTAWEIGRIIDRSEGTVKKHLQRIYRKIGVENRMGAADWLRERMTMA